MPSRRPPPSGPLSRLSSPRGEASPRLRAGERERRAPTRHVAPLAFPLPRPACCLISFLYSLLIVFFLLTSPPRRISRPSPPCPPWPSWAPSPPPPTPGSRFRCRSSPWTRSPPPCAPRRPPDRPLASARGSGREEGSAMMVDGSAIGEARKGGRCSGTHHWKAASWRSGRSR